MPSGKCIDWSQYDHLIRKHLPTLTFREFQSIHAPSIAERTIKNRAEYLKIKPKPHKPTEQTKAKIRKTQQKATPEIIQKIRELRDQHTLKQIAAIIGLHDTAISKYCRLFNIPLSDKGKERARKASATGCLGKSPWNKGKKLPPEMIEKMAAGRQRQSGRLSRIQATFYRLLDELQINYFPETSEKCKFGPWTFDCRIQDQGKDILVEVQGTYIHSLPKNKSKDAAKATYIEKYFSDIELRYVWEHEFASHHKIKEAVQHWLGLTKIQLKTFTFEEISISPIDATVASQFLDAFHYLGKVNGRICLGAFHNSKLVAVSVWGAPTRYETASRLNVSPKALLELKRFVIHDAYHKKNFASWLLSRFEKHLPKEVKMLVSFADQAVGHNGTIYRAANWSSDGETEPSYFYLDPDGYVVLKKTLYNQAHKMHMTEADFAITYNYEKVPSPPKSRFIKFMG